MLTLNVQVPGEPSRRVRVDRPALSLGRSSANDVLLADRTLSRHHARIEQTPDGVVLIDLGSRNGTQLNGARITEPAPLKVGDRIVIGETTIDVTEESGTRVVIGGGGESPVERTMLASRQVLTSLRQEPISAGLGAEELARLNASLRILNDVSMALLGDTPLGDLLKLVLDKVFAYLKPDRGLIMLADGSGELKPEAVKLADGVDPGDIRLSRTLVHSVMEQKNGVLMIDTASDGKLGTADSIRLQGITSILAAPLFVDEQVIGLIYLEARLGKRSFTEEDLRLLTSLANTAAIKIQNQRLQADAAAKQRIEREMALAWDIQRRLLPQQAPELEGTELFGRTAPSRTVSGDYFDFFVREDGTADIVVADVCGKGMGASLLAASVQAAFQAWATENVPPDRLCAKLNDLVFRRTSPEKFVTFITALYDPRSGSFLYTNAGHNPGILLRADGTRELLAAQGPPLGLFPGRTYGSGRIALAPGDLLALYTDGVTEATDPDDEEFGLERLVSLLKRFRDRPLEEIESAVTEGLLAFASGVPFADDRTMVLLRRG